MLFVRVATRGECAHRAALRARADSDLPAGRDPRIKTIPVHPARGEIFSYLRFNATPVLYRAGTASAPRRCAATGPTGNLAMWPRLLALIGELLAGPSPTPRAARGGRDFSSSPARL